MQTPLKATVQTKDCTNIQLRWCPPPATIHTEPLPLPLSPVTPPSKGNAPRRPETPSDTRSPRSPQTPLTQPQTAGLRAESPQTPTSQTPRGRRPPPASPATPKGRKLSGGSASPSPSPLKRNQEEQPPPIMTEGQRAAVTSLLGDSKGRGVVETFASRWLAGRHLSETRFQSPSDRNETFEADWFPQSCQICSFLLVYPLNQHSLRINNGDRIT